MKNTKKKRTIAIKVRGDYKSKIKCLARARELIEANKITMDLQKLAEEIYAHYFLYIIGTKIHWNWLIIHANPIDLEDGGDKWYRQLGYKIIWIIIPSRE